MTDQRVNLDREPGQDRGRDPGSDRDRDEDLDEDRLPWLEAVEEDERGPSPVKLIAAVVIGLIAIGIIVGGLFWLGNRGNGGGEELIASPGDYKMKAPEPGGMQLGNEGSTQVATSEGTEQTSSVNQGARPETPVNQPAQPQPQALPQPQPQRPAPTTQPPAAQQPAPRPQPQAQPQQPRLTGPTIQVGAYPSQEAAQNEWRRLTQRYPYLRDLPHAVTVFQRGGQTFYRLRAAGNQAPDICRRLRAARQPCMDVAN